MADEDYTALPRSRQEAIASGSKFFFTGVPCKNGHISKRYTKRNTCQACAIENATKWQKANPERHAIFVQNWNKNHPEVREQINVRFRAVHREELNAQAAARRAEDPEKFRKRNRDHYAANREELIQRKLAYARANPDIINAIVNKRRAKKMGAEGYYDAKEVAILLERQNGLCLCSKVDISSGGHTVDHYIAISRGGSNNLANLQLLCKPCNSQKGTKTMEEWLELRGGAENPDNYLIVAAIEAYNARLLEPVVIRPRPPLGGKGKTWATNGIESAKLLKSEPLPEGWWWGRTMKKRKKISFMWAIDTEGKLRRVPEGSELPEGWSHGRTPKGEAA